MAPQGDSRVHVYPLREVSHQEYPLCSAVLDGIGQDPDLGLDKLFHCSPEKLLLLLLPLYLRAPESCREVSGDSPIPPRDFSPAFTSTVHEQVPACAFSQAASPRAAKGKVESRHRQ